MKKKYIFYPFLILLIGTCQLLTTNCKKDVIKIDPIISWGNPVDIADGTLLSNIQLNATANVPGTFVYNPALGTQLQIGENQILKVDFTPTDNVNYNAASKTVYINVIPKIDPVITWENPVDINYGILLSDYQLNATANLPGTFVYTPPSGTQLQIGEHQILKVDFTPTDSINYNTASKTVIINVIAPLADLDGNIYSTVIIGTQVWMAENLKTTKYNDGTAIPNIADSSAWIALSTPGYCWYNNDSSTYGNTYGALYNWYTLKKYKLCPEGWHIPDSWEWQTFDSFLGGTSLAGGKLKETGTSHWYTPNLDATNETGFTALPGGLRGNDGAFDRVRSDGYWWVSPLYGSNEAWFRRMYYGSSSLGNGKSNNKTGHSVRCIRD